MLQQTTVVAVVPYFQRFLNRFPNVQTLAAADEQEVLRHWEGLGYYSRARNIHRTARLLVSDHGGEFPRDVEKLQSLPGIGRYTAGAIASFAFDERAPIVEANTLRLYCRLLGYEGDPRSREGQSKLWSFAENVLPKNEPGRFNQALMELGATVCTPSAPDCAHCPARQTCRACALGKQSTIPRATVRPEVTRVTEMTVAVERRGKFLLVRRQPDERWAGLWDFPRFPMESNAESVGPQVSRAAAQQLEREYGLVVDEIALDTEIAHTVTRFRIRLLCFRAKYVGGAGQMQRESCWLAPGEMQDTPLSMTGRKFANLLADGKVRKRRKAVANNR